MKKRIILFVLSIVFISIGFAESNLHTLFSEFGLAKKLKMREVISGNFTDSGEKEYIVMYDFFSKNDAVVAKAVNYVFCFIVRNGKIIKNYEIKDYQSLYFNTKTGVRNLDSMNFDSLGTEFEFGWYGDFNENGRDELCLFQLVQEGFFPIIFEFYEGEFITTLEYRAPLAKIMEVDYKNKKIVLYDSKEKLRLVFKWDLTTNLYHLVE
ncbi:MAG: hypothetical protein GX955_04905 [Treponema sp.]|jgi:hypothetical protein|nr:hypothetical protein [Treponema sp.]